MLRLCVVLFLDLFFLICSSFSLIFFLCMEFLYFHFLKTFLFFWGGKREQDRHSITKISRTRGSNPQEIPIFYPAQPQSSALKFLAAALIPLRFARLPCLSCASRPPIHPSAYLACLQATLRIALPPPLTRPGPVVLFAVTMTSIPRAWAFLRLPRRQAHVDVNGSA